MVQIEVARTVSDQLASALRDQIVDGRIAPGQRLLQEEIAREFNVSITPVREAFVRLAALGLLSADARRGAQVVSPSWEDITECSAIRAALEPLAIEWAIPHMSDRDFEELRRLIERMQLTKEPQAYVELNQAFHAGLYARSQSERLCGLIEVVRSQASVYLLMLARSAGSNLQEVERHANEDHQLILDACRARDIDGAKAALCAHLDEGLEQIRRALHF